MNILYLYSEVAGYLIPVFEQYVNKYNAKVHVVYWDKKKLKPYNPPHQNNVVYYKRSQYNLKEINELCAAIKPNITYIVGWMDKTYLKVAKHLVYQNIPVVAGFDDYWVGSLRQNIGRLIFYLFYRKCFSHAWVAGPYQYEFAKRFGFKNNQIIFNLLSANTKVFNYKKPMGKLNNKKRFLYVGNFRTVKGVDILLEAFKIYKKQYKGDWNLTCVGNGELDYLFKKNDQIELIKFSDERELVKIAERCDVFILASRHDQWGVVAHEFCALGLPLILSENVGSNSIFLVNNYNGFIFRENSANDLAKKMHKFTQLDIHKRNKMGEASINLSKRINPEISAASFISILE